MGYSLRDLYAVRGAEQDPPISLKTLPAIEALTAIHRGPYQEVGVAYTRLFEYMAEQGLELAGPSRALYLNPEEVTQEELMSEIQLPVK
ncbi:MAG: GyrI-like domain-containing protein [Methanolobus sp.]|uniref:GyrI-like domain-containing protein n=1 Tax=Methanolobus sp. TaxID=1874737 RepID=UPI0027312679|nr:GyrI-like domain-containing protein [Methanolobus sp.]MDP2218131.1 GyrI-like domain-containing protein [Methanolobus sp.]